MKKATIKFLTKPLAWQNNGQNPRVTNWTASFVNAYHQKKQISAQNLTLWVYASTTYPLACYRGDKSGQARQLSWNYKTPWIRRPVVLVQQNKCLSTLTKEYPAMLKKWQISRPSKQEGRIGRGILEINNNLRSITNALTKGDI